MKTWRDILLAILNKLFPPERPTIEERARYDAEMKERQKILVDPRQYYMASYEPPSPTTSGKLAAQHKIIGGNVLPAPHGAYFQERKNEFKRTEQVPIVQSPFRTRKLEPMKITPLEGEWQPGDTLHRTPTFLEDQGRKTG